MDQPIANPDPMKVISRASECMRRLMEAGLTFDDLQVPITDPAMRARLVEFWRGYGVYKETPVSHHVARIIMGYNYLGVDQSAKHLRVMLVKQDLKVLESVPFSEAVLEACKDTHVLVAVLPMSVMSLQEKTKHLFYSKDDPWYRKESFAKERGQAGWHLVRKDIVPNSTSKTWAEQQSLLGKDDETPTARVLIYTVILTFLATGVKLLPNIYARVSDLGSDGFRVDVGYFCDGGLDVRNDWAGVRNDHLGVSSARRPNK